ncbi:MAG: BatD family protein [Bacteroidia bacterium]|nr:BatD family protein [Bacteroidia bacterium]NNM22098.1 protein BatD [Flavobacteriaceae bacterium]
MQWKWLTYLFFLLFCSTMVTAQITFEAKVSKKRLGVNERLRVDFEMNQDGDNFNPPDFAGFRIVGGPNQAISNSYINGKRSYSKTYSYFLAPQRQGQFTIAQASIEIDGQTYKTTPVTVQVTAAVDKPKDENDADYLASENVHLVAEVSNSNPYLSEAITVTYKLYVSNEVSITSNWREIDTPKYADFWSQNIDSRGNYKIYEGQFRGENYRYVVLRTTVLYPQKTGKLTIEPLTLDVPIDVRSNRRDLFGRYLMTRVNKTISAGNRIIDVKPLPQEGKPINFTGAVGDFQFEVTSNKTQLDANESMELSVKVSGTGNLKLFDLPSLKLPSSLEVYEPTRADEITTQRTGMRGSMVENYTVVPQFKGTYPIRPISFSYFNPKTATYTTISSKELIVDVENGPVSAENEINESLNNGKQAVVLQNEQFKYIKLSPDLQPVIKEQFFKSKIFWSLLAAPFLIIPLFILVGRKRKQRLADIEGNRQRRATKLAKRYLSEAKKNMVEKANFYEALERALHNYLKAKLSIETSEMEKTRIANLLAGRAVMPSVVDDFLNLLKSCEYARYTPASDVTIREDYDLAVKTISNIDKQLQ